MDLMTSLEMLLLGLHTSCSYMYVCLHVSFYSTMLANHAYYAYEVNLLFSKYAQNIFGTQTKCPIFYCSFSNFLSLVKGVGAGPVRPVLTEPFFWQIIDFIISVRYSASTLSLPCTYYLHSTMGQKRLNAIMLLLILHHLTILTHPCAQWYRSRCQLMISANLSFQPMAAQS